jgi:hypothetical protein
MVARTHPSHGLTVTFHRQGQEVESLLAKDGRESWGHAIHLIAKRPFLEAGDTLAVLDATGDRPGELPEFSRSSHAS